MTILKNESSSAKSLLIILILLAVQMTQTRSLYFATQFSETPRDKQEINDHNLLVATCVQVTAAFIEK